MHTDTTTRCKTHRRNNSRTKRPQPHPSHRRSTFHRRLQPLYTEKPKVSCSGFLPKTEPMQHSCNHSNAICSHSFRKRIELPRPHLPSSPLPFITTSLPHHFPSSPLPFVTTSPRHHFPSSPLPIVTSSLRPLPIVSTTTSLRHHFPPSPLPIVTTSVSITTSHRHHFPSSPRPFLTTSLRHHSPSSSLPFFITSSRSIS